MRRARGAAAGDASSSCTRSAALNAGRPPRAAPVPRRAVQRALAPEREILAITESWFDKPAAKFVFQLKLYTETIVNSRDPKIVHMMFIQVRGAHRAARR